MLIWKSVLIYLLTGLGILLPDIVFANDNDLEFRRYTVDDGISNGNIYRIFQDSKGFIWMATEEGLNFFDGYTFKIFKHNSLDTTSISNSNVLCIIEDKDGNFWIGTNYGLNYFDVKNKVFTKFFHDPNNIKSISSNLITKLCIDKDNQIWIGTDNGLSRYNPEKRNFTRIGTSGNLVQNAKGNWISDLVCDKNGIIWTSEYYGGIYRIDPITNSIKNYPVGGNGSFLKNIVISICPNPNGNLWLGLINGQIVDFDPVMQKANYLHFGAKHENENNLIRGIVQTGEVLWYLGDKMLGYYNTKTGKSKTYSNEPDDPTSFPKGTPLSITQTRDGNIWIGVEGAVYFNPAGNKFSPFYHIIPKETNQIKQNYVTCFQSETGDNLLVGTFLDGLIKMNIKTGQFKRLTSSPIFLNSIIYDIKNTGDSKFWIATSKGLALYNSKSDKIERNYFHSNNDSSSLYHDVVQIVFQDRNRNLWISTQESLDFIKAESNTFIHFTRENLRGLSHYKITAITDDREGNIWIGTVKGLNKLNPKNNQITQYLPSPEKKEWISDSFINHDGLYQDKSGFIWICTKNGLNKYDPKSNSFTTYYESDGLLSDNVFQIIEDDSKNFWVTSSKGLSKVNLAEKTFRSYSAQDGLDLNAQSFFSDTSGFFYVGGRHENFYKFHPDSIHDNLEFPEVAITDLLLFNKPVGIYPYDKNSPLKQNIRYSKEIILNYKQSDFAFEFTALNYSSPEKNRFAYKMEGFNDEWIYTDSKRRVASYTNLRKGDYVFRVKASNNDGVWNDQGAAVKVKILPAPWETNFALTIYVLFIFAILYIVRLTMLKQIHLKNSLRLEHLEREKENEFSAMKTKFFTNISHEFKTPLTLISGPVKTLIKKAKGNTTKNEELEYYYLIERNVSRIMQLTNQLLDFRKIETGTLKLELYQANAVQFIQNIIDRFEQFAQSKQISLQYSSSEKVITAWFDPDKLEKIISNLLSNAMKFTGNNGTVKVNIELAADNNSFLIIEVRDTGIGIAPDNIGKVFDRFYQVDRAKTKVLKGTGIGLSLAKEMAVMCKGDITVVSTPGSGTTFKVILPIALEQFENYSIISDLKETDIERIEFNEPLAKNNLIITKPTDNINKTTILIIEDNKDLRYYMADILKVEYHIIEAENGLIGLEVAFEEIPDIIICDIMMPEKDGIEVTKTLKTDSRTSHIPIILVTALSSLDNQVKGLETGANDYITKPFVPEILLLKIKNSINYTLHVKEFMLQSIDNKVGHRKSPPDISPKELIISSLDEKIIAQALEIIEENISDPKFNVDRFSKEIGMESSTLYKKLMALIGMPPGEFIRDVRMKRAAQLLAQNKVTVSDIAYMVGFDSPNYFSKVFRKYYNVSPSEFITLKKND